MSKVVIALATTLVAALHSQSQPDFSGTWTLDSARAPSVPVTISVKQGLVRTDVRGEPMAPFFRQIVITRSGRTESFDLDSIGGSISGVVHGPASPRRTHQRVGWENQALVFESGSYTGEVRETGVWTERRETWSMDSEERLRVRISTRGSTIASSDDTQIYRRE